MIKSRICDLLGIRYPLLQGGMAWIADAKLAAAVSNAGGLGLISSINFSIEAVREEIRKCKTLTDKPFGVNIMLQAPNAADVAQLVLEEKVRIVTTGAGTPAPYFSSWKEAGVTVIPVIPSVAYAVKMQALGVDALVAEGAESGGHIGELNTFPLIPQIVDSVDIPVIAAGGVFDGRAAAAAFMLGAEGVQLGTRFLIANECRIHETYKEKLLAASDVSTIITGKTYGDTVRSLKTPFSKKFLKMELDPAVSREEAQAFGAGSLRKAVFDGDLAEGCFLAGEVAGMIQRRESAKEIVEDIMEGAERLLAKAPSLLKD